MNMRHSRAWRAMAATVAACAGAMGALAFTPVAAAQARRSEPAGDAGRVDRVVRAELEKAVAKLGAGPTRANVEEIEGLFDLYLAYGSGELDGGLLTELAAARRVAIHTSDSKNTAGKTLAPFLVANPELERALVFLVRPEDDVPAVYAMLGRIKDKHEKEIADRGGSAIGQPLAAAVCVVFDKPPAHPVLGEGGAGLPTPAKVDGLDVFEYFLGAEGRLVMRPKAARVWVNMVDVHSDLDDLRWALQNYAGNQQVGRVYSSIVYDTGAFKFGREKKVFKDGYTLKNIKKVGGVCTEQAFFASEVAKAIGVPSVYVTGDGADVGHAWVGYMKNVGGRQAWDFSEGRFGDYKTTQGRVTDPQTGKPTTDAFAGLTEWMVNAPREKVWEAGARTDAAARLVQKMEGQGKGTWPPAWPGGETWGAAPAARSADAASALAQLRAALTACAGYEPAWRQLMAWSDKNLLDGAAKKEWGDVVMKMAGRDRPDFAFAVLTTMIRSVENPQEQSRLWDWAAGEFQRRPDLVSSARLSQGQCWEKAGDNAKAWDAYKDVISRFANDGRSILLALARAELLLKKNSKDGSVVGLYEDAFRRISKPGQMSPGFETASNYFQVGMRYSKVLEEAGRGADAARVRKQIGAPEPTGGKGG